MLRRSLLLLAAAVAAGCANTPGSAPVAPAAVVAPAEVRAALAPTGTLRVALYSGSPSSMVVLKDGGKAGVTYELGQLAAKRLGVPVQFVELPRAAEVFNAVKSGQADMTFTNASEARMREADFTPVVLRAESGYLVTPASGITDVAGIDRANVRVGVAEGGSSHATLSRELKQARVLPINSLDIAARQMTAGQLEAFASNKAILFELADKVPGSKVLPGRWAFENFAIAVPKGRGAAANEWLRNLAIELKGSAQLQGMVTRAGLRGTVND